MGKKLYKYCIAIPAYKNTLTVSEKFSLKRLHDVVKNKENVYLFCPFRLDMTEYKKIFPEIKAIGFNIENFVSIDAYSHLCMSYDFYNSFSEYEYMLIYQLDCYLVKDNIEEWCYKGYDYIGAPILVPHSDWKNFTVDNEGHIVSFAPSVGNGGLSLRNIDTFLEITDPRGELRTYYSLTDEKLEQVKYEDVFFCVDIRKLYDMRISKWNEAMNFAIDMNPDIAYDRYGMKGYPMGIHAFEKNIPFWKGKIDAFNSQVLYEYCYNKHKEFIDAYYLQKHDDDIK